MLGAGAAWATGQPPLPFADPAAESPTGLQQAACSEQRQGETKVEVMAALAGCLSFPYKAYLDAKTGNQFFAAFWWYKSPAESTSGRRTERPRFVSVPLQAGVS